MAFVLVVTSLLSSHFRGMGVDVAGDNVIELHNPLTAFKQCSNGDKKWRICRGDYFTRWYCPTVLEFNSSQLQDIAPCFTCPDAESDCEAVVSGFIKSHNISEEATYDDDWGVNIADQLVVSCKNLCEAGKKGETCWSNSSKYYADDSCTPGSSFCDFASDEESAMNISGTCKACPSDQEKCYEKGFVTSSQGKLNCAGCRLYCWEEGESILTVNGNYTPSALVTRTIQKPLQNALGPLIDCSNLLLENEDVCLGAEGHVCIVNYSILRESEVGKLEWRLSNVAEENGCAAIITIGGSDWHGYDKLMIPFITVSEEEGKQLLNSEHNAVAQVEVQLFGSTCSFTSDNCNIKLPCAESKFCFYSDVVVGNEYVQGICRHCPSFDNGEPDSAGCFFDRDTYGDITFSNYAPEVVKSCAQKCKASIASDGCKFCPGEVSALDFGVENKADQCHFCPNNDVQYPDKFVPLFGVNITCLMVQTFFNRMEVHKDSPNCRLVQSMNYMCGCYGTGYAGANTPMKQVLLVWLPRVAAILSLAGSSFIVYDTMRTRRKRAKLMNQLLSALSLFDMVGSCAYALTTLPTPASDELYGSKGNERTCTAQGFFIQIGAIACYINVSLAIYYLLTIKYGWSEGKLKRNRAAYFLFIPPIVVGLVYAFVGIPFYDNVRVWCNNSAKWWPETPVILAITVATGVMGNLSYHVYRNEKRTARYTNSGARLSIRVFKQSCWFVVAFYITWVPYLALQYILSSGQGYDNYGLISSAATLVPLQGFWNNFVYIRTRYLDDAIGYFGSTIRRISSIFKRSSRTSTEQCALEVLQQSEAHDQLQVVEVDANISSTLDVEGNLANSQHKAEVEGKALESTTKHDLGPQSDETCGRDFRDFARQSVNKSNAVKDIENEVPLKVSTKKRSELNQEGTSSADNLDTIDVGIVSDTTFVQEKTTIEDISSIQRGDRRRSLINFIGTFEE